MRSFRRWTISYRGVKFLLKDHPEATKRLKRGTLFEASVAVLKIEGRARFPEYVKPKKIEIWKKRLEAIFNRGFWDGYYLGKILGEWSEVYGSKAAKRKIFIGKVTHYFGKIGVAEVLFETAKSLSLGDKILITGTTTGAHIQNVEELRTELDPVNSVGQKDLFSIKVSNLVRRGDKLYKLVDNQE